MSTKRRCGGCTAPDARLQGSGVLCAARVRRRTACGWRVQRWRMRRGTRPSMCPRCTATTPPWRSSSCSTSSRRPSSCARGCARWELKPLKNRNNRRPPSPECGSVQGRAARVHTICPLCCAHGCPCAFAHRALSVPTPHKRRAVHAHQTHTRTRTRTHAPAHTHAHTHMRVACAPLAHQTHTRTPNTHTCAHTCVWPVHRLRTSSCCWPPQGLACSPPPCAACTRMAHTTACMAAPAGPHLPAPCGRHVHVHGPQPVQHLSPGFGLQGLQVRAWVRAEACGCVQRREGGCRGVWVRAEAYRCVQRRVGACRGVWVV